jgi:hypothetical protein
MDAPNWKLDNDDKTISITFSTNPFVQLKLNVGEVEEMLKNLGRFRAMMKPEIATQFPPGQKVEAVSDPSWLTEIDAMAGSTLLHLRDPRYGWLHYLIPADEARKLAGFLQARADAPAPGQPEGKPN